MKGTQVVPVRQSRRQGSGAAIDLLMIVALACATIALGAWFDLFEHVLRFVAMHERYQLDEVLLLAFILPIGLTVFSWRRWRELRAALRERARLEQQLAEAARIEGVLLAARTMQHEINNQLTLTVGYAEMLATDPTLSAEHHEMLDTVLQGAEAAVLTLTRLSALTRLKEARPDPSSAAILDLR